MLTKTVSLAILHCVITTMSLLLYFANGATEEPTCYNPDGSVALTDLPCDPRDEGVPSACCGQGFVCATNGLCLTRDGFYVRGTCTDPSWTSVRCAAFCLTSQFARCQSAQMLEFLLTVVPQRIPKVVLA